MLVALVTAAFAGSGLVPPRPCGTFEQLRAAPPLVPRLRAAAAGSAEATRDAYGAPNLRTSEHFALRWGNFNPVSIAEADRLLEHFELAWDVEVEDMGHEQPRGSDRFLFNLYVGDTGSGTPSSLGAGGYMTNDPEGWPMVVIARASFYDADYLELTAVHEFYHAIQSTTERFPYDGLSAWYWEATAEWASLEASPDNPSNGSFIAGYVWLPEIGLPAFDYPDEGTLEEYHQYGAFLFATDLTARFGRQIVTDTWMDESGSPDPIEVMRRRVEEAGGDFDREWIDHLARTVLNDGPHRAVLSAHLGTFGQYFNGESTVSRGVVGVGGGKVGASAPYRYGAFVLVLRNPEDGALNIQIDGDRQGTLGSPATFSARVVIDREEGPEYVEVPIDRSTGELEIEPDGDPVYVVVGATTPETTHWDEEQFPFSYTFSTVAPPVASDDGTSSGAARERRTRRGCEHGDGAGLVGALGAALLLRRRSVRVPATRQNG